MVICSWWGQDGTLGRSYDLNSKSDYFNLYAEGICTIQSLCIRLFLINEYNLPDRKSVV